MTDNSNPLLTVRNLVQKFGKSKLPVVNNLSFNIFPGEVFGLVGESGCGKTTTGRSIIGLNKISGGRVFFEGKLHACGLENNPDMSKKDVLKFQKKMKFNTDIQMIFQDPVTSIDPRMTVLEVIAEGLVIKGEKDKEKIRQEVNRVLKLVGLRPEYADRYPHEFSGGQKQRIGIARAIIMKPKLIIADEPVSALDVSIKAQIINLLNDLRKELGLTILFVAHDLSVVKYLCDRIAVMYKGQILELAESDELFENPVHPYTKSLLSAIPVPDPEIERNRQRIVYEPEKIHDYSNSKPEMMQVCEGHFVLCTESEKENWTDER